MEIISTSDIIKIQRCLKEDGVTVSHFIINDVIEVPDDEALTNHQNILASVDAGLVIEDISEDYKVLRLTGNNKYPSLQDQADMQFHDLANGTTTWLDAIQAVKDAYPKPI